MKRTRLFLLSALVISLMLVSSCQTVPKGTSGEIPGLTLAHGWSPPQTMTLNGEQVQVRCMEQADIDLLTTYLKFIETMGTTKK